MDNERCREPRGCKYTSYKARRGIANEDKDIEMNQSRRSFCVLLPVATALLFLVNYPQSLPASWWVFRSNWAITTAICLAETTHMLPRWAYITNHKFGASASIDKLISKTSLLLPTRIN